jgi:hypothetical protein
MEEVRDYTIKNGIGIRVKDGQTCRVIRHLKGAWIEIGQSYELPIDKSAVVWTSSGIPATVLAVALRVYELDHPESNLRSLLTRGVGRYHTRGPVRRAARDVAFTASSD